MAGWLSRSVWGWRSVTSFFRERKLRLQERQTQASRVCVSVCALALPCMLFLYNQSGCPTRLPLWMPLRSGVQISSFNSTHSFGAVCVVEIFFSAMCLSLSGCRDASCCRGSAALNSLINTCERGFGNPIKNRFWVILDVITPCLIQLRIFAAPARRKY